MNIEETKFIINSFRYNAAKIDEWKSSKELKIMYEKKIDNKESFILKYLEFNYVNDEYEIKNNNIIYDDIFSLFYYNDLLATRPFIAKYLAIKDIIKENSIIKLVQLNSLNRNDAGIYCIQNDKYVHHYYNIDMYNKLIDNMNKRLPMRLYDTEYKMYTINNYQGEYRILNYKDMIFEDDKKWINQAKIFNII